MKIKKYAKLLLTPLFQVFNSVYFSFLSVVVSNKPSYKDFSKQKILILAPHIDDDTIGCFGAIEQFQKEQSNVLKILFLTDGKNSINKPFIFNLAAQRKKEAFDVANQLGINDLSFLNFEDSSLGDVKERLKTELEYIINEYRPTIVFLPFILDYHKDHIVIAQLLADIEIDGNITLFCYNGEYGMSDIFINNLIETNMERKLEILKCYKSQNLDFKGIIQFEKSRSLLFHSEKNYEGYFSITLDEYKQFVNALNTEFYQYRNQIRRTSSIFRMVPAYQKRRSIEKRIRKKLIFNHW